MNAKKPVGSVPRLANASRAQLASRKYRIGHSGHVVDVVCSPVAGVTVS